VVSNWKDPKTIRRYLDNEVFPALGDRLLKDVTALDVQSLVYRKRDNGQVAAAIQLRGVLEGLFDYAIETRLMTINPAAMVATRYIGKPTHRRQYGQASARQWHRDPSRHGDLSVSILARVRNTRKGKCLFIECRVTRALIVFQGPCPIRLERALGKRSCLRKRREMDAPGWLE
jgi:hypothetical protein